MILRHVLIPALVLFGAGCSLVPSPVARTPIQPVVPSPVTPTPPPPVVEPPVQTPPPVATSTAPTSTSTARYPAGASGVAISYPQCPSSFPTSTPDFAILGVTYGRSLYDNPCFKAELTWAEQAPYGPSYYINLDYPAPFSASTIAATGCQSSDEHCLAYHHGLREAQAAYDFAVSQGAPEGDWWLDVQTISRWSKDLTVNAQVARGAIDFFRSKHLFVGLSTTPYQWGAVMGTLDTGLPNWIPGRANKAVAADYCLHGKSYSGGSVLQLAYIDNGFEAVYACGHK